MVSHNYTYTMDVCYKENENRSILSDNFIFRVDAVRRWNYN